MLLMNTHSVRKGTFFQPKVVDIFLIFPWKHMLWYPLEAPGRGTSNGYSKHVFMEEWKNKKINFPIPTLIWSFFNVFFFFFFYGENPRNITKYSSLTVTLITTITYSCGGLMIGGVSIIFFSFLLKNLCCGYSLEASQQGAAEVLLMNSHNISF